MCKVVTILYLLAVMGLNVAQSASDCYRLCRTGRTHGMKSEECFNVSLRNIPECLSRDVEVLDLSMNRISKLIKKHFSRFGRLKLLYLTDNKIVNIDSDTFDSNTDLQVLDLSLNSIRTLPENIFKLPSLRKLYLSENEWLEVVNVIEEAKPITSPLEFLDISAIPMDVLPDLGVMPYLLKYNISNLPNEVAVSVKHFAGLCNLKFLENTKVSAKFDDPCECLILEKWLKERNVRFKPFNCNVDYTEDCSLDVSAENLALFEECKVAYDKIVLSSKLVKILVPIAVIIIIALLVAVYIILKRKKNTPQKKTVLPKSEGQTLI